MTTWMDATLAMRRNASLLHASASSLRNVTLRQAMNSWSQMAVGQARAAVHGRRALVRDEAARARAEAQRPVFVAVAGAQRLKVEQLGRAAAVARPRVANLAVPAGPAGRASALGQERVVHATRCAAVERRHRPVARAPCWR